MHDRTGFVDKAGHRVHRIVGKFQELMGVVPVSPGEVSGQPTSLPTSNATSTPQDLADSFSALSVSSPTANATSTSQGQGLATSFDVLPVSSPKPSQHVPAQLPNSDFVGGFNVVGGVSPQPTKHSRPPAMPIPQVPTSATSLTMHYAMHPERNDYASIPIPSPHTTPTKPQRPQVHNTLSAPGVSTLSSLSPPVTPARPSSANTRPQASNAVIGNSSSLSPPVTPASSSSSSAPPTPSGKTVQKQCAGITKAGKRCTRQVKVELMVEDDEDEEEDGVPRFCYQHAAEVLSPSGYYSRKNAEWVNFDDWIPGYLRSSTQASLRAEMEKTKSSRDVPGYIYTFEIREPDVKKTIKLKVGRAVNLVKRTDQWSKQCSSKEQVLRGFYPGSVEEGEGSLMKGRVQAGEKAAWCHRLERLIHIELADLVSTCVYLEPGWPNIDTPTSSATNTPTKSKPVNGNGNGNQLCPDCGSMHREIFEFRRWEKGRMKGKEWECIVKPVVERWGRFVDLYV